MQGAKKRLKQRMAKSESQSDLTRDSVLVRNVMETSGGDVEKLIRKVRERYEQCDSPCSAYNAFPFLCRPATYGAGAGEASLHHLCIMLSWLPG